GRRPALAVAVRHERDRAGAGLLARPHGVVVQPGHDQQPAFRPGPPRRSTDHRGGPAVPAVDRGHAAATSPAGGLLTWSWQGAVTGLFWAGLVRVGMLHHVTWSVNSICHMVGSRPFRARDRSANFWPLALLSFGESWHNSHHADPTCARHGVRRGQLDISARVIWLLEKLGWAYQVRWPTPRRLARLARD